MGVSRVLVSSNKLGKVVEAWRPGLVTVNYKGGQVKKNKIKSKDLNKGKV